ncbi:hypothetical protein PIGHUM_03943 [Pigmentiphaga humi]|uniref:Uncharacterized protein n=1 Tax=Pigmentiphaga humi TaxID=2478468 RepID=A0A3P4B6C4_9BURK|nr:hypothetical protein [Pigmentiphaga humi]VCU71853.1 hypothetical protein PIGHUM_03943 [Pigmentiphaga humi]
MQQTRTGRSALVAPALRPAALACLACLASCGGGSTEPEPSNTSLYPALAANASMDEEDFNRYLLNASRGTDITPDSIKSLSVGSSIDSAASTYNLRPIFDLGRLKEDNRLNVDTTGSQEKTELRLTSNKTASSASSQTTIDGSVSGTYSGFRAAGAYHQANAWESTNSDGTISVQMVSANTNNVVALLNSGFTGTENLTPYLIGTKLTDEQLQSYVATTESAPTAACAGKPYIASVKVDRYKQADTEPYANIQLLTRMETVFSDLRTQHGLCTDASIQALLVGEMTELRRKIVSAIADFYAFNGDSFVSRTTSMNRGIAKGQLTFSKASGNTEAQYGASLSVEYETLNSGAGASGSFQYYKQNGWASAVQNVQVSAESMPAGVADTAAWVNSLHTMLKDQSTSEVPPMGSLPKDPGVKLPEPVGPKHPEQDVPPDTAFTSYDQWKQYQADKKAAKDADQLERSRKRADSGLVILDADDSTLLQAGQDSSNAYLQLVAELDTLNQRAKQLQQPPQASEGNLVRFDKMYVNGFETLPYDGVIPQLRPNLDIPGATKTIGSFPHLMDLMLGVEKLGRLDSYLRFLANFSASNVTPEMSARYHQFYLAASARAYELVTLTLQQGTDLTTAVLAGYKKAVLGTSSTKAQSELYKSLQDLDYYDYVMGTLLDPVKGKAWAVAPGGYMPLRWTADGGAQLVTWTSLQIGSDDLATVDFSNPNTDPLSLYRSAKSIQTPWYPVYIFNQGSPPTLVFVQNFGAYQAIYGASWTLRPYDWTGLALKPALNPKYEGYQVLGLEESFPFFASKPMREVVAAQENSFLERLSWNYSVNFPQSGNDPARLAKFNVLMVVPLSYRAADPDPDQIVRGNRYSVAQRYLNETMLAHYSDGAYSAFRPSNNPSAQRTVRRMSDGAAVDIAQAMAGGDTYVMLLPLSATTVGDGLKKALNFAPERTPLDIVNPSSLGIINKLALLLE